MKTLLVLAAGAALGFGLHYVYEFGLELWMVGICSLVFAGGMFYDYHTRPGVKRGRK
jgi:type IV secretory pathway TrbD component